MENLKESTPLNLVPSRMNISEELVAKQLALLQFNEIQKQERIKNRQKLKNKITVDIIEKEFKKWQDGDFLSTPNHIARSSIFAPVVLQTRKTNSGSNYFKGWGNTEISISGDQLDQRDHRLFIELIKNGKTTLNNPIYYSKYELLEFINAPHTGANYKWLTDSIRRLSDCNINIRADDSYIAKNLRLLDTYKIVGEKIVVVIGCDVAQMFKNQQFAILNAKELESFKGDFTSWLYGFIKSHSKQGGKITIHLNRGDPEDKLNLKSLCGRTSSRNDNFRTSINNAATELQKLRIIKKFAIYKNESKHYIFVYHRI